MHIYLATEFTRNISKKENTKDKVCLRMSLEVFMVTKCRLFLKFAPQKRGKTLAYVVYPEIKQYVRGWEFSGKHQNVCCEDFVAFNSSLSREEQCSHCVAAYFSSPPVKSVKTP